MSHLFRLSHEKPKKIYEGGYRLEVTKSCFPALRDMSLYKILLQPRGIREPHWHANADELGYCLKGQVLISIYGNGNKRETFLVSEGEAFFIPSGTLHALENVSEEPSELIFQFSHQEPEDFGLSSALGMFSNAVLGNTWQVSKDKFQSWKRPQEETLIAIRPDIPKVPREANYASIYRYRLKNASPLIANEGGTAQVARQDVWPILKRQALYLLELTGTGMREPHWHPETAEMGYVESGKGRMSVLSPSGDIDTYEMTEGDLYFIPRAYPHHIENLTNEQLKLAIFFDHALPGDVGFTASVKSYSDEVLAAIAKGPKDLFASLPTYYEDLFIVNKLNPLDN
jgi:oxalate decarboxylase